MKHRTNPTSSIFKVPAAIGTATLVGLVLGLTGDGWRDVLAWLLAGLAPITIAAVLLRRGSDTSSP